MEFFRHSMLVSLPIYTINPNDQREFIKGNGLWEMNRLLVWSTFEQYQFTQKRDPESSLLSQGKEDTRKEDKMNI